MICTVCGILIDMQIDNNYFLVIAGIVAIVLELFLGVATGFDLALIGVILIIGGAVGSVAGSFSLALGVVAILSLLYVFIGRAFIKNKLTIQTRNTNVEALIGKKAMVVKKITSQKPGQVKVEGEIWRAEAEVSIDEGTEVNVKSVSGVTLKVA